MTTVGFIGVGDLANYTIKGLRLGGYQNRILLSPRNQGKSNLLAKECHCEVMVDNQAVVDASNIIFISTRPEHCLETLAEITLTSQHTLISVVAGVSIDSLRSIVNPDIPIIRAMPVNCAEAGASPTLIYPDHDVVKSLFEYCGTAIAVEEESAFENGSVLACVYTWYFELFEELIQATTSASLPRKVATDLVLGMAKGAASLATLDDKKTPGDIADFIATEGTFSKLGLDLLKTRNAFQPWREACQLLNDKLG